MNLLFGLLLLTGFYPLARALRANRDTTLRQPLLWTLTAWAAWLGVACRPLLGSGPEERLACYGALCLTGCAGIAVLGARRPGVTAWNFVVVGLLAVLLLPILNGMGELRLEAVQEFFLGVTLLVSLLNHLPTRLAAGVSAAAAGCALEMTRLIEPAAPDWFRSAALILLALGPWLAWAGLGKGGSSGTEFDRLWRAYRDRFGFVWGQRMREQFNRAASHAGFPVVLRWTGLQPAGADTAALRMLLLAVLKRFGPEEETPTDEKQEK